jgi:hypothetical protein
VRPLDPGTVTIGGERSDHISDDYVARSEKALLKVVEIDVIL